MYYRAIARCLYKEFGKRPEEGEEEARLVRGFRPRPLLRAAAPQEDVKFVYEWGCTHREVVVHTCVTRCNHPLF